MQQPKITSVCVIDRKSSNKIYIRAKVDGKQTTRATSYEKTPHNLKYVKKNQVEIFTEIINEEFGNIIDKANTLKAYGLRMLDDVDTIESREQRVRHTGNLNNYILPFFPEVEICNITIDDIENWQKALKKDPGVSADTRSRSFDTFKMIVRHAAGRLEFNDPFEFVKKLRKPEIQKEDGLVDYYTFDEVKKMFKHCEDKELLLYMKIAAYTGLRENEILALRKNSISLEDNRIYVKEAIKRGKIGAPKTEKRRSVPLLSPLREYLLSINHFSYKKGEGFHFIFQSPRKKARTNDSRRKNYDLHYYDAEPFRSRFKTLLEHEHVQIEWIGLYELKHSFATSLVEAGVPITAISKMLGHSTIEMTMKHYIKPRHYNDADIEKAETYFNSIIHVEEIA